MKKSWAVIAMLAAMCCVSCNEEENESTPCVENTRSCSADGKSIGVCVNGEMIEQQCPSSAPYCWDKVNRCVECFDDMVVPVCDPATNSVKYCSDGMYKYTKCMSGTCVDKAPGSDGEPVTVAAYCSGGSSDLSDCEVGKKRCDVDGRVQVCGTDGKWGAPVSCPTGSTCQSGECKKENTCVSNTFQCANSTTVQKCVDGSWQTSETCDPTTQKCNASSGRCIDKGSVPSVNDPCDEDFEQVCTNETLYYCATGGKVAAMDCKASKEMICKNVNGEDDCLYDGMGDYCSAEGDNAMFSNSCEFYAEYGLITYLDCVKVDGVLYGQERIAESICMSQDGVDYAVSCVDGEEYPMVCSDACEDVEGEEIYNGYASCELEDGDSYVRCSEYDAQCNQSIPGTLCVYPVSYGMAAAWCASTCTTIGSELVECAETSGGGYAVFTDVCTDLDGTKLYVTDYSKTVPCTGACATATTCAD